MTQIREATQESVTAAEKKVELVYCIQHERMVQLETCDGKEGHTFVNGGWDYGDVDFCYFPMGYTACPPPPEAIEVGEDFFNGDWAAQPDDGDMCADEVGMWED